MFKKKKHANPINFTEEGILVAHAIKYNLYLIFKGLIFSSILRHEESIESAITKTNIYVNELDLETKTRMKSSE